MAYLPIVIPYPGTPGALFFDRKNITDFLDLYSQLCADYYLLESEKIYRLPWYCEFFTGNYIKILIKGADWAAVRSILRKEYKDNDLDQLMNSREFLEALKKKSRSDKDDILYYCRLFASISKGLVLRRRLDPYTQCQWFLQGLPETILTELFYRYDIDLEDEDDIDFDDLLEKALVLIRCKKWLADFIEEKESTWMFRNPQKDQPTTHVNHRFMPPVVLPPTLTTPDIVRPLTSTTRNLTPTIRVVQGSVPVARIGTVQAKRMDSLELIQGDNDCGLNPDPAENILEDLNTLFADCGSVNEEMMQVGVCSIGSVKLSERSRNVSRGGPYYFSAEPIDKTRMSATGHILSRERGFRHGNLLNSSRLMKCEDHGWLGSAWIEHDRSGLHLLWISDFYTQPASTGDLDGYFLPVEGDYTFLFVFFQGPRPLAYHTTAPTENCSPYAIPPQEPWTRLP